MKTVDYMMCMINGVLVSLIFFLPPVIASLAVGQHGFILRFLDGNVQPGKWLLKNSDVVRISDTFFMFVYHTIGFMRKQDTVVLARHVINRSLDARFL